MIRFVKVHGTGNDFILLPDWEHRLDLSAPLVRALCRPHLGLGADGVLRVSPPRVPGDADVFMDYRNADGSIAETCGNGIRCVAKYVLDRGLVGGAEVRVDTRAGVKRVVATRGADGRVATVCVEMGAAAPGEVDRELDLGEGLTVRVTEVSMGNPHAVVLVDDVNAAPVARVGAAVGRHAAFPDGVNVEFIEVPDRGTVLGRIHERGVGETLASGSGASAMAVAAALLGRADRRVTVRLPGGDLAVAWDEGWLTVTGPAVEVASGELDDAWLSAVPA